MPVVQELEGRGLLRRVDAGAAEAVVFGRVCETFADQEWYEPEENIEGTWISEYEAGVAAEAAEDAAAEQEESELAELEEEEALPPA